jgi:spermidine/putrescine transport system substrate-binding protein
MFVGCSDKRTLSFYTWDDYIDPDIVAEFENENNCRVIINVFDSNEAMYAKLLMSTIGYDLILPSSYQIVMMKTKDMLEKLDFEKLPNVVKNFDKQYNSLMIPEIQGYSIPYAFSMTGLTYDSKKFKKPIDSWKQLNSMKMSDRICLFNDVREIFGAALKALGYSGNSTNENELAEALKLAKKWKKISTKFDNEAWKTGIASGEFNLVMSYNSDVFQIMSDEKESKLGTKLEYILPKEGIMACFDEFVLIKTSKNKDLAYKFIDFLYRPDIAKRNIEYILAVMPNKEAVQLLSDEMKNNPMIVPSSEMLKKCEIINCLDAEAHALYIKSWDELKATK